MLCSEKYTPRTPSLVLTRHLRLVIRTLVLLLSLIHYSWHCVIATKAVIVIARVLEACNSERGCRVGG